MASGKNRKYLEDKHRAYIVRELACFASISAVQQGLKEQFGREVSRQNIENHDPTKYNGRTLGKRWKTLFATVRAKFLEHIEESIPESIKAVRLQYLAEAARDFRERRAYLQMAEMLEAIAKEVGNVHTNRRELTGRDGKPIQYQDVSDMTPEQIDAELAELVSQIRTAQAAGAKPH